MGNGENWLALFYGAALIGAVTVPVNTRFKSAEIDFCVKQADCKTLFYVERFLKNDYGSMVSGLDLQKINVVERMPEGSLKPVEVSAQDVLLIQFTSGYASRNPRGPSASGRWCRCPRSECSARDLRGGRGP